MCGLAPRVGHSTRVRVHVREDVRQGHGHVVDRNGQAALGRHAFGFSSRGVVPLPRFCCPTSMFAHMRVCTPGPWPCGGRRWPSRVRSAGLACEAEVWCRHGSRQHDAWLCVRALFFTCLFLGQAALDLNICASVCWFANVGDPSAPVPPWRRCVGVGGQRWAGELAPRARG